MNAVEELSKDVQLILDLNRAYVEKASHLAWNDTHDIFPLIPRTVLRRQFESLEAISYLVNHGMGFAAGPILRPFCEEFIWMKYLLSIPSPAAEGLVRSMTGRETYELLSAQQKGIWQRRIVGARAYSLLLSDEEPTQRQGKTAARNWDLIELAGSHHMRCWSALSGVACQANR